MRKLLKYLATLLLPGLLATLCLTGPVFAAGSLLIDGSAAGTGTVGSTHTLTGTGFTAGESVTVFWDGSTSLVTNPSLSSLASGGFTASILIPAAPSGIMHTISAVGSVSGNSTAANFSVQPSITISAASALVGTSITVTGAGFQNAETSISTTFDGTTAVGTDQTASATGAWTNTFPVPNISPGAHVIHAKGSAAVDTTINFTVIAPPRIAINLARGTVGTQVTVSGTAFAPNEGGISVTLGNTPVGATATANSSGAWALQFAVPDSPGGTFAVAASGNTTQAGAAGSVNFTVLPSIDASPQAGPSGTSVTVTGSGFGASESNIFVTLDGADQGSAVKADANGAWSSTFSIPVAAGGPHTISAHGPRTLPASIAPVFFRIGSGISINRNSGPVGSTITVSGNGFAINEQNIAITFDGTQIATATAGATGIWTASVAIPVAAGGDHTILARGRTTTVASGATFSVTPTISVDKSGGTSGTSILITGQGFAANETGIVITFDGVRVGQPVTASANGSWTSTFQVPASSSGTHLIGVNGSVTQVVSSADLSFKISASLFLSQAGGFPGSQIIVSGSGFAAGSTLQITFDDNPLSNIGAVNSDQSGNFSKTITIPAAKAGAHAIKVMDSQNNTDSKTFTIDGTPPAAPRLISPEDASTEGFFGGITPVFKWAAVTDPRGDAYLKGITYELVVDTNSDFSDPVIDSTGLTKTSFTPGKSEALERGQYFWRVRAVDAASNAGDWSAVSTLTSGMIATWVFALIIVAALLALFFAYWFLLRRIIASRRPQPVPQAAPEVIIPEIVNAEYRITQGDEGTGTKALPWRLALPQAPAAPRGQRSPSAEDQARLKTLIDFARSLPLAEPGPNTGWLVDLAESESGTPASPTLYSGIVKGEIQIRYEPAWMRHPSYLDLESLLEGQPVLTDLNAYIEAVNQAAGEAVSLLQDIYGDISVEVTTDIFPAGGWSYISGVYADSFSWFRGRYLRTPSERDYSIKPAKEGRADSFALEGEPNTPFSGRLIVSPTDAEATQMRTLHLQLRRAYRNSEKARQLTSMVSQLEVQRARLQNAFAQFNRLGA